ncbi:WXG100 family type VII secretion target [Streptomyces sp. NPDC002690]
MARALTPGEFKADLAQLLDAVGTVKRCTTTLEDLVTGVDTAFTAAEGVWHSRAGTSFVELHTEFDGATAQLIELLHEMARRMRSAYDQYLDAETKNTGNFPS